MMPFSRRMRENIGPPKVLRGDCLEVLKTLPSNSLDACITDGPYGIGLMGKDWDRARTLWGGEAGKFPQSSPGTTTEDDKVFQSWSEEWGREVFRVLKPGAYIASFGATRTYHRMACGLQDAGFQPVDAIMWAHGQGFPKSQNDGQGRGTALKPAIEMIALMRKPREGTYADNADKWRTGYLNIDDARVPLQGEEPWHLAYKEHQKISPKLVSGGGQGGYTLTTEGSTLGRWPSNVVHDGSDGLGTIVRFHYCAKPSPRERTEGLPEGSERHPTQKPIALMRWLVRLLVPHGGKVLDPFIGSGTTAIAAVLEDRRWVGIEREEAYADIADARIMHWWRTKNQ